MRTLLVAALLGMAMTANAGQEYIPLNDVIDWRNLKTTSAKTSTSKSSSSKSKTKSKTKSKAKKTSTKIKYALRYSRATQVVGITAASTLAAGAAIAGLSMSGSYRGVRDEDAKQNFELSLKFSMDTSY